LTQAVAELYEKVKANPEAYPRGMTVRIMLGNVPELAVFEPTNQMTSLLQDLRDAGVTKMIDEEIGWNLEVANFGGAWPHAHSKFVVVDGKTALAAGFNYSYLHLPKSHPSGKGLDMNDLGLQITGPLAQTVMAAYDDLWSGSDLISCSLFPPPLPTLWFLWCDESIAEADHVPEVMRFYPTGGDSNAFALHHTMAFLESDEAIVDVLNSAQETIDVYEVNFSLDTICIVASLLGGLCDTEELIPPYMKALVTAVVENDVQVRVLVEPSAMNGLENRIAIRWLQAELETHGKVDNVRAKFYDGKMHDKGLLIDEQLLIIGSQNFHWSAWDTPSLTEYNLATEDPVAIHDFLQDFEYQWGRGKTTEESMAGE
jgi:phosphatidylserine/phosphatidylglycerophosphate/cardiolipin synthase-like enzyme